MENQTSSKTTEHHATEKKDKVPLLEKLMYGAGSGSFQMANDGVHGLVNPIFNITLGLSPSLIGLVLMISRIFDAFTDPLMGKISDDTRSRFGRRRPYILIGAFLTAIAFIILWRVPEAWSMNGIFIYFLAAMLLFSLCTTIQNVPYHTLGLEMTADYHERTVVSGYKMAFSFIFTLFLPWVFRLAQGDNFANVMEGMRTMSWGLGLAILLGGVLPALFVKERYYKIAEKQDKAPFWKGIQLTFSNRPFLALIGIILCTGIGGGMVGALGPYVVYYHMFDGDLKAGAALFAMAANVWSITALISIPIITIISKRYGKVHTLRILIVLGIIGAISKFFFYSKDTQHLIFLTQIILAPMSAGFWTLTTSMKADVCDDDEEKNGMRREGIFGAVGNWILKVTGAVTFLLAGLILEFTGFDVKLPAQSPETLMNMRLLFSIIPALFGCISLYLLSRYPLTEKRMTEIRTTLESRRSVVS